MNEDFTQVAEAFSRKALVYDDFGVDHENLTRMRQTVYAQVQSFLEPGDHILELNAGTGADAVHFAKKGFQVHATDISPGMVKQIGSKIQAMGLNPLLSVEQLSFTELHQVSKGPFQHIYSNFGGLNCISDLREVTKHIPKLLQPGKLLTWVIMPRVTPWDWRAALKGDWRTTTRRLQKDGIRANVEGVEFQTYYFSPKDVMQALGPGFEVVKLQGLSTCAPPADNDGFAKRHPKLYRMLVRIDETIGHWRPFNGWGDFFILSARYQP
ncbi:MAG: class I SAM-dependent methyltransferase [Chloroflexi bacterium]|nr:MAG: class I SAM-dependent methyltransferase [Chloroflexota bacterium]MBL1193700.1 class I SAM-dependent methyltransferase [Chloroflexota bacterium]NOH10993.1 methyltransferase domain-containing protein [Chloroflexota bacterium]